MIYDFAIVGGGIAGTSLAATLAPDRSVAVLERESAWGYHATGRSAAEFTRRFHGDIVGRLTTASQDFMLQPPDGFSATPLLHRRGNLVIAHHDKATRLDDTAAEEAHTAPPGASPLERLSPTDALERVPFLDPSWLAGALFDPDCWDIEVESLLQGYRRQARGAGATTELNWALDRAHFANGTWTLGAGETELRARVVVNAAGAWADTVAALCGVPTLNLQPLRRTAINLPVDGHDLSTVPEVNEVDEDFYFKPDAGQLFVSPADETPVDPHDAWPEEMDIAIAADHVAQCTTLEITRVAHSWAGLRTFAPDRLPVVGYDTGHPGFFWYAGQGGYGIQTSSALARVGRAAALGEPADADLLALDIGPERFAPHRFASR
ncbi:MAG: FAD-binding oxidoreductase [Pseudomonadota bacterium]